VLNRLPTKILSNERTPFALAMKSEPQCIDYENPVRSYRMFYQTKQTRFKMVWTKRDIPNWFNTSYIKSRGA
jgi:hypothetical protein